MKVEMEEKKEEKKVEANKEVAKIKETPKKEETKKVDNKKEEPKKEPAKKEVKVTGTSTKKTNNNAIIIGIVVAVVAIIAIVAGVILLGKDTPKTAVEKELKNIKAGAFATEMLSGFTREEKASAEVGKLMTEKLEWKVVNEKEEVEGEIATVELEITNKDFKTIMGNVMQKAFKSALTGGTNQETVVNDLMEELKNEEIGTKTVNATIELKKEDGKWKVADEEKFYYAILPGFQEVMEALN